MKHNLLSVVPTAFKAKVLPSLIITASLALAGCGSDDNDKDLSTDGRGGNNAPIFENISVNSVTEGEVSTSTVIASFNATDLDKDELIFSLSGENSNYFIISGNEVLLTSAGVDAVNDDNLDLTSLSIQLEVSDGTDITIQDLAITVVRVDTSDPGNAAPVFETISVNSMTQGSVNTNTVVATFTATDADDDALTYSLSGDDSGYFTINGSDVLLTSAGVEAINDVNQVITSLSVTLVAMDGTDIVTRDLDITVIPSEPPRYIKLFEDDFESGTLNKWTVEDLGGSNNWVVESYAGNKFAVGNCYGSDAECDDWMVTPEMDLSQFTSADVSFTNAWNYGENATDQLKLKVSTDYAGDASVATWTDLSGSVNWSAGSFEFVESGLVSLDAFVGQSIYIAFHYNHPVAGSTKWEFDEFIVDGMATGEFPLDAEIVVADETFYTEREIQFNVNPINGAGAPYTYAWDFGDSNTSDEQEPTHTYTNAGSYEVQVIVTDSDDNAVTQTAYVNVEAQTAYMVPANAGDFRIATFNIGLPDSQEEAGIQEALLDGGDDLQAQKIAEIIQRTNPDVLLINEIDGNDSDATVDTFMKDYLEVSQNGAEAIEYDYVYSSDCNTGVDSGVDYNNNGTLGEADDAYGFGRYPGQYCMVILSKYEIDTSSARTFQNFLWKDMPGANEPLNADETSYYSAEAWDAFRLSSKTHIDLPILINGEVVHVLASHPTPPVFDGDEDRNGKRNFDEIRMWADYIDPNAGDYLYDDNSVMGVTLAADTRFVIMGDENASSVEGDAFTNGSDVTAINQLLDSAFVNPFMGEDSSNPQIPVSAGGADNDSGNIYGSTHTASWQMRADYVLPSAYGLAVEQSGVFWPMESDDLGYLTNDDGGADSSDHRLVWMDLTLTTDTVAEGSEAVAEESIASEDFSDLSGFTVIDDGEADKNWGADSYGDDQFAKVSCYGGVENCDDWLIKTVDLTDATTPWLSFRSAFKYGPGEADIALKISTDFDGSNAGTATWIDLSDQAIWSTGDYVFTESGDIDLTAYAGETVYVAFHYTSDPADSSTWEIANFAVSQPYTPEVYLEDDFSTLNAFNLVDAGEADKGWGVDNYGDDQFAKVSCYGGAENCDDWLIIPADLIDAENPVLTFRSAFKYGPGEADIALKVSTDFNGTDVNTATWINLSEQATWSTGDYVFVDSGDIDLSAYEGETLYIAFHYTSDPADSSTWEIANLKVSQPEITVDAPAANDVVVTGDIPAVNAALNMINKRATGTLSFNSVAAPVDAAEEIAVIGSDGLTVDGEVVANSGYKTLLKSGDNLDGNIYGAVSDSEGNHLFVSNYNEFTSILPIDDRIFAVSQFESIPGGMHLVELEQDAVTGELSPLSTQALDFSAVNGGYNHCAAMVTPWNSHLASEEYEPDAASRSNATGEIDSYYDQIEQYFSNKSLTEINPYWYGYPVEVAVSIDDDVVSTGIDKHYAMGRVSIEIAYVMPDRKTVYLTDDGTNGGLFMFVADTEEDLSAGNLYAMKWNQTSEGSEDDAGMGAADLGWISLGHATNAEIDALVNGDNQLAFSDIFDKVEDVDGACPIGFSSINFKGSQECLSVKSGMEQAASRLETRRYAALLGATVEMRKEEGFTYSPSNHKAYMAIADLDRGMLNDSSYDDGGANHMQLAESNSCGGIYELTLGTSESIGSDYVAASMAGLISGSYDGNGCDVDDIAGPDNVVYVGYNTLVITEDTDEHHNNFVWSYDLEAETLTRIFSAPTGAENTGPYMFNNINGFAYITNVVQHPAGEKADPSAGNEAELGYFGPIPVTSSVMSVTEALAVTEDQAVVEVIGVITGTVVNEDFAMEIADENDPSQTIYVQLLGDQRTLWGPESNPGATGTTVVVIGERDLDGYFGSPSIEGTSSITAQ
jgi:PKD repeat protein